MRINLFSILLSLLIRFEHFRGLMSKMSPKHHAAIVIFEDNKSYLGREVCSSL